MEDTEGAPRPMWVHKAGLGLLGLVALLLAPMAWRALQTPDPPPSPRWEYAIVAWQERETTERLREAGAQGWELVSIRRANASETVQAPDWRTEAVLKRQLLPLGPAVTSR